MSELFVVRAPRIEREIQVPGDKSISHRAVMLAAVETVTQADPVWLSRRHDPDTAAKAATRESVHAASPL